MEGTFTACFSSDQEEDKMGRTETVHPTRGAAKGSPWPRTGSWQHMWTDARTDRRLLEMVGAQGRRKFNRIDSMIDSLEMQRM